MHTEQGDTLKLRGRAASYAQTLWLSYTVARGRRAEARNTTSLLVPAGNDKSLSGLVLPRGELKRATLWVEAPSGSPSAAWAALTLQPRAGHPADPGMPVITSYIGRGLHAAYEPGHSVQHGTEALAIAPVAYTASGSSPTLTLTDPGVNGLIIHTLTIAVGTTATAGSRYVTVAAGFGVNKQVLGISSAITLTSATNYVTFSTSQQVTAPQGNYSVAPLARHIAGPAPYIYVALTTPDGSDTLDAKVMTGIEIP